MFVFLFSLFQGVDSTLFKSEYLRRDSQTGKGVVGRGYPADNTRTRRERFLSLFSIFFFLSGIAAEPTHQRTGGTTRVVEFLARMAFRADTGTRFLWFCSFVGGKMAENKGGLAGRVMHVDGR